MRYRAERDPGHELNNPCHINRVAIGTSGEGQEQHGLYAGPDSGQSREGKTMANAKGGLDRAKRES